MKIFSRLNIRQRFILYVSMLIIIQAAVFSVFFLTNNLTRETESARARALDYIVKCRIITDTSLSNTIQKIKSLNVDNDLFSFYENVGKRNFDLGSRDLINSLNNRYFWDTSDYIATVNLAGREYSSTYSNFTASYNKITALIPGGENAAYDFLWFPNEVMEGLGEYIYKTPLRQNDQTEIFVLVRRLSPAVVRGSSIVVADMKRENPFLMVGFRPELYSDYYFSSPLSKSSSFLVVTPKGEAVTGTESLMNAAGETWFLDALRGEGSGIYNVNGKETIVCYSVSAVNKWILATFVPLNDLMEPAMSYMAVVWAVIAVNAAGIMVSMYFISKRVTRPIHELAGLAKNISSGSLTERIEVMGDIDVNEISQVINQLNDWLDDMIKENSEVAKREQDAVISTLEMQLNPHFLYNTLNIINLIALEAENREISAMIVNLSGMMQYTIHMQSKFSNCAAEVEFLDRYVYLMSARFPGKFKLRYDISQEARCAIVPKMLLQPFVENAILHGLDEMEADGEIIISAFTQGPVIIFRIQDNGKGISDESWHIILEGKEGHIGCANVNKRLKLIFGQDFGLNIISRSSPTVIEIKFPFIR